MPSRNRSREAKRAAASTNYASAVDSDASKKPQKKPKSSKAKRRSPKAGADPSDVPNAEVRYVQPYEATKSYLCPGCGRDISPGQGHVVAVPPDDPDLRRHWHRGCWDNRHVRR